jgi:hypothetical protein
MKNANSSWVNTQKDDTVINDELPLVAVAIKKILSKPATLSPIEKALVCFITCSVMFVKLD